MKEYPNTECDLCWNAEATQWQKILKKVIRRESAWSQIGEVHKSFLSAILGTPQPTWYRRHYALFVTTGDPKELERMQRHVM